MDYIFFFIIDLKNYATYATIPSQPCKIAASGCGKTFLHFATSATSFFCKWLKPA